MIALYLLACHMVGDYLLQSRWTAERKLRDPWVRFDHCGKYTLPFVVLALTVGHDWRSFYVFPVAVFVLHYLTDSRRFRSSLGDWLEWHGMSDSARADVLERHEIHTLDGIGRLAVHVRPSDANAAQGPLPPNPWEPLPLLIDQTLHLCQLALLGGLLLA